MSARGTAAARRLLIVGNPGPVHVGAHLRNAAAALGVPVALADARAAFAGPAWRARLDWWARGHRPARLRAFSQQVVAACVESRPAWLIATGLAPLEADALARIGELGVQRLNFLTDDPWNPAHRAGWFFEALPRYDRVYTPRRANLGDLERLGCSWVGYLPFAYAPELHYPDPPATPSEQRRFASDLVFVGGADRDRVPFFGAAIQRGFDVRLYGNYWGRFAATRARALGEADPSTARKALGGGRVSLCLVRRANRDGHAMRSFEAPASGACLLAEDTPEHRALFGADGQAVVYFRTVAEMLERLAWLLAHEAERRELARAAHRLITGGRNTYADRLAAMLQPGLGHRAAASGRA